MNLPGIEREPEVEDSLENTFSCVPKVQGESRISQANGRRCLYASYLRFFRAVLRAGLLFNL